MFILHARGRPSSCMLLTDSEAFETKPMQDIQVELCHKATLSDFF